LAYIKIIQKMAKIHACMLLALCKYLRLFRHNGHVHWWTMFNAVIHFHVSDRFAEIAARYIQAQYWMEELFWVAVLPSVVADDWPVTREDRTQSE
jgi:hypothetical protein